MHRVQIPELGAYLRADETALTAPGPGPVRCDSAVPLVHSSEQTGLGRFGLDHVTYSPQCSHQLGAGFFTQMMDMNLKRTTMHLIRPAIKGLLRPTAGDDPGWLRQ